MAWTPETKAEAIQMYLDGEPTPSNSMEIAEEISNKMGETVNSVRMMLVKAEKWIKKDTAAATPGKTATGAAKTTRVSKEDSQAGLTAAIEAVGKTADSEIISKLTGKAAVYFTSVLQGLTAAE